MSPGRHFLQIPGPTNLPARVAQAIARPTIDHRGPEFRALTGRLLPRLQRLFQTEQPVIIYPSSARGAWEAALVNTLSPGDKILFCDNGHFASLWYRVADQLDLDVERLEGDWRHGFDMTVLEARLAADTQGAIKAVALVHNETSTGVVNDIAGARRVIDSNAHSALLMVDVVSSLAAMACRHDLWGVDVAVAGSQKGLMLPPGLSFTAVSEKALAATASAGYRRSYWDWQTIIEANRSGIFPHTPATNLLFGLDEALNMLEEEGIAKVYHRHLHLAEATRDAVASWGMEVFCLDADAFSPTLTAVLLPEGHDADRLRSTILSTYNLSLGTGLGFVQGKLFRIGHLGDFNELMLMGTLCGVEMGFDLCGIPHRSGGVLRAMDTLVTLQNGG